MADPGDKSLQNPKFLVSLKLLIGKTDVTELCIRSMLKPYSTDQKLLHSALSSELSLK
jgi:hypothetical protein